MRREQQAELRERKAIAHMLMVQSARALHRSASAPWWALRRAAKCRWAAVILAQTVRAIELGEHHDEQAAWLIDIDGGELIRRSEARANQVRGRRAARISASGVPISRSEP